MRFGRSPFARRFGGGPSVLEIEHMAMLDALSPGWDVSEDTAVYAEACAHALAITMIWRVNGRLRNSRVPLKMMETLPVWEQAFGLRPAPGTPAPVRRRTLAAKMLGIVGNTVANLYDVCAAEAGPNFAGLGFVDPSVETVYWPGVNPGPPGYEWSSNRATMAVQLSRGSLKDDEFGSLVQRLWTNLRIILPAWMTFQVGTLEPGGFIAGVGVVNVTLL